MATYSYLFAFALLATPADRLELPDAPQLYGVLGADLKVLALRLEVLDPRESYLLQKSDDFATDLQELQKRYQALFAAPPLADCKRFPNRETVADYLASNRLYYEGLRNRLELDHLHSEDLKAALAETDFLYRVWDKVRDANSQYYYIGSRRQALQELREMVGDRAYFTGQLPPHVPLWRIPIAD